MARVHIGDRDRRGNGGGVVRQLCDLVVHRQRPGAAWDNVFTTGVVLGTLGINLIGSRIVDRAQTAIVLTELVVFAVFIVATLTSVEWSLLPFSGYPPFSDIVASVA